MNTVLDSPIAETIVVQTPDAPTLMTADEFWLSPYERAELIEGTVIEMAPPGGVHGEYAGDLYSAIKTFVRRNKLGRVFVETGFRLKPILVRSPDVSFVEAARFPDGKAPRGFIDGAPTLAVEIVAPGDLWTEVEGKVNLYLEAGSAAVWIVEPDAQTVTIRTADNAPRVLRRDQTLDGGAVLPGFALPLHELFEDR